MRIPAKVLAILATVVAPTLAAPAAEASFPGANGKIAYQLGFDIYTVNPDGTDSTNITRSEALELAPAWSADGTKIAFVSFGAPPDFISKAGIYTMNADGSERRRLTTDLPYLYFSKPSWSPDGRQIAFGTDRNLYVMNSDGTGRRRLAYGLGMPSWSPDGSRIAFTAWSFSGADIFTIRPDGREQTQITADVDVDLSSSWSPDGKKIAFSSRCEWPCYDRGKPNGVYTIDANGEQPVFFAGGSSPAWSPDGTLIAFRYLDYGMFLKGTNGPGGRQLAYSGDEPDWQPLQLNNPPDCSGVTASAEQLWPPRGRFAEITLNGATDPDGDAVTLAIDGVTQDEPVTRPGEPSSPDAVSSESTNRVQLRAERDGQGDGRVYQVAFTVTDAKGATCTGAVAVSVAHDQSKAAIDSAPPSYNSLGS